MHINTSKARGACIAQRQDREVRGEREDVKTMIGIHTQIALAHLHINQSRN
jgi:hypothetical protein